MGQHKHVWFIRHAESITNAGGAWDDPATIPLTPKGYDQAARVAEVLKGKPKPSLIVTSPYTRTYETAKPTLAYLHDVEHTVWPVHEFTYLSAQRLGVRTTNTRYDDMNSYWEREDPEYIDGPDAESYIDFMKRVDAAIACIQNLDHAHTFIFSHGQFLKALFYRLAQEGTDQMFSMAELRRFSEDFSVRNTAVAHYTFHHDGTSERHSLSVDHLIDGDIEF